MLQIPNNALKWLKENFVAHCALEILHNFFHYFMLRIIATSILVGKYDPKYIAMASYVDLISLETADILVKYASFSWLVTQFGEIVLIYMALDPLVERLKSAWNFEPRSLFHLAVYVAVTSWFFSDYCRREENNDAIVNALVRSIEDTKGMSPFDLSEIKKNTFFVMSTHATLIVGLYAVDSPEDPYLQEPIYHFDATTSEGEPLGVSVVSDTVGSRAVRFVEDSSVGGDSESTVWRFADVHALCLSDPEYKRIDLAVEKVSSSLPSFKTQRIVLVLVDMRDTAEYYHPDLCATIHVSSPNEIPTIINTLFAVKNTHKKRE